MGFKIIAAQYYNAGQYVIYARNPISESYTVTISVNSGPYVAFSPVTSGSACGNIGTTGNYNAVSTVDFKCYVGTSTYIVFSLVDGQSCPSETLTGASIYTRNITGGTQYTKYVAITPKILAGSFVFV